MGVTQGRLLPAAAQRAQTMRAPGTPHHCVCIYTYLHIFTHIYTYLHISTYPGALQPDAAQLDVLLRDGELDQPGPVRGPAGQWHSLEFCI